MAVLCLGCSSGGRPEGTGKPSGAGKAFLDETKQVPARREWNREIASRAGGTITFRVTSQGPFMVSVLTAKGYQALQAGDKGFDKSEILLTVFSPGPPHEGKVTVPAGSSYFIIENQTDRPARIHLECFPPG